MYKFIVLPCSEATPEDDSSPKYQGHVVPLGCPSDMSLVLFFPIDEKNASIVNYLLSEEKDCDFNSDVLGLYQTMLDSWTAGDRFLSGIIMESVYSEIMKENVVSVKIILSSHRTGRIEGFVKVNFAYAIILAAMEKIEITIDKELIDRLMPSGEMDDDDDDDDERPLGTKLDDKVDKKKNQSYPVDENILEIAKGIMSGRIK
jgi:hypothetical protein